MQGETLKFWDSLLNGRA